MKRAKPFWQKRFFWKVGASGFLFVCSISLLAGNLLVTSMERGIVGFVAGGFVAGSFRYLASMFVNTPNQNRASVPSAVDKGVGVNFDVSLPAESPDTAPVTADFQPWVLESSDQISDSQAQDLADALRSIQK